MRDCIKYFFHSFLQIFASLGVELEAKSKQSNGLHGSYAGIQK